MVEKTNVGSLDVGFFVLNIHFLNKYVIIEK